MWPLAEGVCADAGTAVSRNIEPIVEGCPRNRV